MTKENKEVRTVVWTGEQTQPVLVAISEGGEIGGEVHDRHDQLLHCVEGSGRASLGETEMDVAEGDVSIVPSGMVHDFRITGSGMRKLYTTCNAPEHARGTEQATRAEAGAD